jgi:hypothetical protein
MKIGGRDRHANVRLLPDVDEHEVMLSDDVGGMVYTVKNSDLHGCCVRVPAWALDVLLRMARR